MDNKQIEMRLRKIIEKNIEIDRPIEEVSFSESLESQGININSISFIKLVVDIEIEFDIDFDDNDINFKHYSCLNDVVSYIEGKMA